jgi:hypothetical protein
MRRLDKYDRKARSYAAMTEHEASISKTLDSLVAGRITILKAREKLISLGLIPEHAHAYILTAIRFYP